jgi:hypothetical protein
VATPVVEPVPDAVPVVPAVQPEKPEGATSQANPPADDKMPISGFPDDLEPSVVTPFPAEIEPPLNDAAATPAPKE